MEPPEDAPQCPIYHKVFTLWTVETQTIPSIRELWRLFPHCFPVVLSLALRRSCHHLRIKTQPKTEGEPSADLQNARTLACTPLLQYTLRLPAPPSSLLSGPLPCNSWSSRTLPRVPSSSSLGSLPSLLRALQPTNSLMALHELPQRGCSHSLPFSGIQAAATCHSVSKSHCLHIDLFVKEGYVLPLPNKPP